jgi:hypothetical protein
MMDEGDFDMGMGGFSMRKVQKFDYNNSWADDLDEGTDFE